MKPFAAIAAVLLFCTSAYARTSYEFDWVGGQPGYAGRLFLDAPAKTSGTTADVLGGFVESPTFGHSAFNATTASNFGPLDWTTTGFINLRLSWSNGPTQARAYSSFVGGTDGVTFDTDSTGSWIFAGASVPDAGSTFAFSVIAFLGMLAFRQARTVNRTA